MPRQLEDRIEEIDKCPECGSSNISHSEKGEWCGGCGLVLNDMPIDHRAEYPTADDHPEVIHYGPGKDVTRADKGLGSYIGRRGERRDAYGHAISTEQNGNVRRMRVMHSRSVNRGSDKRSIIHASIFMNKLSSDLGLPNEYTTLATNYYQKIHNLHKLNKFPIEKTAASCLYLVCKQRSPIPLAKVAKAAGVSKSDLGRSYRVVTRALKMAPIVTRPEQYVPSICSDVNLKNPAVQALAIELCVSVKDDPRFSSRKPPCVSAIAVYCATRKLNEIRTQKEIAEVAYVTEVSIRKGYPLLESLLAE